MARPGLLTHRKFIRLARTLGSDALAFGHLGIIWDACYESGDPNIGASEDVEYLARWRGDNGLLTRALVDSGFLDVTEDGSHHVHDLFDHAPDYVQRRMIREQERRSKGMTLSDLRAKAGKASGEARRAATRTTDEQVTNTCSGATNKTRTNGATPAPSPSPSPSPTSKDSVEPAAPDSTPPNPPRESQQATRQRQEPAQTDDSPVVMEFPCAGSPRSWLLRQSKVDEYRESFPGLDVLAEVRKARQWCIDNATKRKTHRGMPAFLGRWLSKQQDRSGGNGVARPMNGNGVPRPKSPELARSATKQLTQAELDEKLRRIREGTYEPDGG